MKMKKKGKVYPSPPPPSSSSSHYLSEDESLSMLKLLPASILVLVSILSVQDREVLAYLITRGTTISSRGNPSGSSSSTKKNKASRNHKPPVFDCECFDCYTNYWFRWDSSPNRELIHEIIEAFENHHHHLTHDENSVSRNKSKRGKKKEKPVRRVGYKDDEDKPVVEVKPMTERSETTVPECHVSSPERLNEAEVVKREPEYEIAESTVGFPVVAATGHKGLARKVLPDVLGLINSNFWRLWNPNA